MCSPLTFLTVALRSTARVMAACLVVLSVASRAGAGQGPAETVGIMRFVNLSGADEDSWVGTGIVEALAVDLSGLTGINVVGREDETPPAEPTWLITGSYQRVGEELRIIARLIDRGGRIAETTKTDGPFGSLFDLQDQMAAELTAALQSRRMSGGPVARPESEGGSPGGAVPPLASGRDTALTAPTASAPGSAEAEPGSTGPAVAPTPSSGRAGFSAPAIVSSAPPPPVPPAVIRRDAAGRATVRAVRITAPIRVDGALDERVYADIPALSDFIQQEPIEGAAATEKTEAWLFFDDDNVYVSARAWDSAPESQWVANEMRRDSFNLLQNEGIHISFDTFYDRRNSVVFNVSPIGGRMDGQVTDERNWNGDWNPIWDVGTGRFEGGWTMEAAIPFKSLRYRAGQAQTWGFVMRRVVRWKNEISGLTLLPTELGLQSQFMASLFATMVGLEVPASGGGTLELKPYAITEVAGARRGGDSIVNDATGDAGFDVKYGVTQNLVADLTVNTDFAQVEADEQQVNLTRFSLFFPEKREFFLENQGTFAFGGAQNSGARGGGTDTPVLFYSREIGLDRGREIPMDVGGRLTGRIGRFTVGFMNVQTGGVDEIGVRGTNFTVARVRRDILRRSNVGVLFTGRSVSKSGAGSSETYGVDGVFSFYDNLNVNTYWAKTATPDAASDDVSYKTDLNYNGDRYGVRAERLVVGGDFRPELGFLRRDDFDRRFGQFRFSPRPEQVASIRKLTFQGQVAYVLDREGLLETRENQGQFMVEFENADIFDLTYTQSYELLKQPFPIAPGVTIPVGGYSFGDTQLSYSLGPRRAFTGRVSLQHGSFYGGDKTTIGLRQGRMELTPQFSLEPSLSYNRVDLPEGSFTTNLFTTRTTYTLTPLMFVSALLQYNSSSDSLSTNVRLRWEYQPGSELFVVYNEQRDTLVPDRFSQLENRAFIVKINRLFRF